jgi:hypothetical protein
MRRKVVGNKQQAGKPRIGTQMTQIKRIFADKKKSAVIFSNLRHLRASQGE